MGDYGQHPGYTEHYFRLCTKEKKGIHSTESKKTSHGHPESAAVLGRQKKYKSGQEVGRRWVGGGQEVGFWLQAFVHGNRPQ